MWETWQWHEGETMTWMRVCCHCNGIILKDEGKFVDSTNYGKRHFMVHKSVTLCKERHHLRVPEDIAALMKEAVIEGWTMNICDYCQKQRPPDRLFPYLDIKNYQLKTICFWCLQKARARGETTKWTVTFAGRVDRSCLTKTENSVTSSATRDGRTNSTRSPWWNVQTVNTPTQPTSLTMWSTWRLARSYTWQIAWLGAWLAAQTCKGEWDKRNERAQVQEIRAVLWWGLRDEDSDGS